MIRVALLSDDPAVRRSLRSGFERERDFAVTGEAETLAEARERLAAGDGDVVVLDLDLAAGSGLDLMRRIPRGAAVVCVSKTAQHAWRAFEVNAVDYLLKPVDRERLADSIGRVRRRLAEPARGDGASPAGAADKVVELKAGAATRFAPLGSISLITAQENYTLVRLTDGEEVLVRRSLKEWEARLPRERFVKVHRQMIVNLARVAGYRREGLKRVALQLEGMPVRVGVSRRLWAEVRARFDRHLR